MTSPNSNSDVTQCGYGGGEREGNLQSVLCKSWEDIFEVLALTSVLFEIISYMLLLRQHEICHWRI